MYGLHGDYIYDLQYSQQNTSGKQENQYYDETYE